MPKSPSPGFNYYNGKLREITLQTFQNNDLRGMKFLFDDVNAIAKDLNKEQIAALNKILKEKFGDDLNYNSKKIANILKKGAVKNMSEYKLLFDYFEEIYSGDSRRGEMDKIKYLLEEYQKKMGKV